MPCDHCDGLDGPNSMDVGEIWTPEQTDCKDVVVVGGSRFLVVSVVEIPGTSTVKGLPDARDPKKMGTKYPVGDTPNAGVKLSQPVNGHMSTFFN